MQLSSLVVSTLQWCGCGVNELDQQAHLTQSYYSFLWWTGSPVGFSMLPLDSLNLMEAVMDLKNSLWA